MNTKFFHIHCPRQFFTLPYYNQSLGFKQDLLCKPREHRGFRCHTQPPKHLFTTHWRCIWENTSYPSLHSHFTTHRSVTNSCSDQNTYPAQQPSHCCVHLTLLDQSNIQQLGHPNVHILFSAPAFSVHFRYGIYKSSPHSQITSQNYQHERSVCRRMRPLIQPVCPEPK